VHCWGIAIGLPWAQYDESWATPASAGVLSVAPVLYLLLFRRSRDGRKQESHHASSFAWKLAGRLPSFRVSGKQSPSPRRIAGRQLSTTTDRPW
jgi:hypothetical protein